MTRGETNVACHLGVIYSGGWLWASFYLLYLTGFFLFEKDVAVGRKKEKKRTVTVPLMVVAYSLLNNSYSDIMKLMVNQVPHRARGWWEREGEGVPGIRHPCD